MVASSVLANFVLTIPTVSVELIFARLIYHVSNFGDFLSLTVLFAVGVIAFGSLGLVVASVTNTMQETQVLNNLIWLPMIFLSGATLPIPFLPKMVQAAGVFLPATYLVTGLQNAIFLSFPIGKLLVQIISLVCWAALTFFVAAQLFRWEPEVKIPRKAKLWAAATALPFFLLGVWENNHGQMLVQAQAALRSLEEPAKKQKSPEADSQAAPKPAEKADHGRDPF
jgi:hypothetical protein